MRKYKRILLIAAGVVAATALVGGIVALVSYNEATKIDRSVSSVVVRQYIDEVLMRRDDGRAALFACSDQSGLQAIHLLRDQIDREQQLNGSGTQIVPAALVESEGGRVVTADLRINQGTGTAVRTRAQLWRFTLENDEGWRVCSAEQLPGPSPTATSSPTPPTAS